MAEGGQYSYPDKMSYSETIMFIIRAQAIELAQDGITEQYEDMVDFLGDFVWPFMDESGKGKAWETFEKIGKDIDMVEDRDRWLEAKRERCRKKMRVIMEQLHADGLLFRRHRVHKFEADYDSIPVDGAKR